MPITLNSQRRRGFLFGRASALRSTSDLVDQLQEQLQREREQHKFNVTELEKQIALLLRDLMQAKYEIAQRNVVETFAKMESPSASLH